MGSKLLVLVFVPVVLLVFFYVSFIPSTRVMERVLEKSTELDSLYENWLILRSEIPIFLASNRSEGFEARFIEKATVFERNIEYLLDDSTFEHLRGLYPEVDTLRARILTDWQEIQYRMVVVISRGESFDGVIRFFSWMIEGNDDFDASISSLLRIIKAYSIRQIKMSWSLFYLLSIAAVVVFFLFLAVQYGYERAKRTEGKIRRLSRSLITVREHERKRIALDLHDVVVQELAGVRLTCERILDGPCRPESLQTGVREIAERIDRTTSAVRDIAFNLRSPELGGEFLPSVRHHCEDFSSRNGIDVQFRSLGFREDGLSQELMLNLFRMIQEALNNVLKHSEAEHVTIRLIRSFPFLILRIEDDGKGFDVESLDGNLSKSGMGLHGMEDRVGLFNGRLSIKSSPGQGTRIVIRIPWKGKVGQNGNEDPDR